MLFAVVGPYRFVAASSFTTPRPHGGRGRGARLLLVQHDAHRGGGRARAGASRRTPPAAWLRLLRSELADPVQPRAHRRDHRERAHGVHAAAPRAHPRRVPHRPDRDGEGAPGAVRLADRPSEPGPPLRARRSSRSRNGRTCRSPSSSSTSTTSRRSTTRSATRSATSCWRRSASGSPRTLAPTDTVARLGGDEFAVVVLIDGGTEQERCAARVPPTRWSRRRSASRSGSTSSPSRSRRASAPRSSRTTATRSTSSCGGPTSRCTRPRTSAAASSCTTWRATRTTAAGSRCSVSCATAIDSGEIVCHYQPKVDLQTGRVVGAEALVRWDHPEHGHLKPDQFIPLAEPTGLISPLTLYVLDIGAPPAAALVAAGTAALGRRQRVGADAVRRPVPSGGPGSARPARRCRPAWSCWRSPRAR